MEKGRADFDAWHSFVSSLLWQVKYFGRLNPVMRGILNGWAISGIVTLRSGLPFTVTTGKDTNLDGNTNDRGNLVGRSWFTPYALLVLDRGGVAEVPLVGGAAQRVGTALARADSLTTNGRTIVIGTADDQMQISLPVTSASTTISWQQKPANGANPIYPG